MTQRISTKKRKQQASSAHNKKYDYSLWPDVVSLSTHVDIICPIHGTFSQSLSNHIHRKSGCPKCKQKVTKETWFKKYGVENPSQSEDIKNKKRETSLKNWGVDSPNKSEVVKNKKKETNLKNWGFENPSQSEDIKKKKEKTSLKNWGVPHPNMLTKNIEKMRQTLVEKHGVEFYNQKNIPSDTLQKMKNKKWLMYQHHILKKPIIQIADELNINFSNLARHFRKLNIHIKYFNQSIGEKQLNTFITNLGLQTITNSRNIIPPYEIDIFIPDLNLAIEYNGEYWHNLPEQQNRDNIKQNICEQQNITLITIWHSQWINDKENTKQQIIMLLEEITNQTFLICSI